MQVKNAFAYRLGRELCADMQKRALFETLRHGAKALWQLLPRTARFGKVAPGMLLAQRQRAATQGQRLVKQLGRSGINVVRGRVKSPASMLAKGLTAAPDDLLGMQAYVRNPAEVQAAMQALKRLGVKNVSAAGKLRPGYAGINIKGMYRNTPLELQLSPGRLSNAGQLLEHSLGYKATTEAPYSTFIDRFVGRSVAPRMVQQSWLTGQQPALAAMGVQF